MIKYGFLSTYLVFYLYLFDILCHQGKICLGFLLSELRHRPHTMTSAELLCVGFDNTLS